ncbi:helix-turn-helix transcriptional regulator [Cohnella nanjingensis]|uniref:YafY family transcriptional regulator n=1 Tax=Cohnella nanjingensis TaxID=1387779 RepID=A0A7X0RXC8_9BACL|nr:YafY family protein [Cohnella nanjingensis]MBB6675404.1 YafY family transcriptional regulator [Cohnella nanjingensis]
MHKSQRLIRLMMIVHAKKSFTIAEIAYELGVSPRTVSRDLMELGELGVPLYSIQGRGGGYKLLNERALPPITFIESEAIAIYFAVRSLHYFGALPFGDQAESALDKFYHHLPSDAKKQIDRLKNKVIIWSPNRPMSDACLTVLLQAVMIRSAVTIAYRSSEGGVNTRDIQPIGLYSDRGYWYCPAYCFARRAIRLFRADRIAEAKLNNSLTYREDADRKSLLDWEEEELDHQEKILFRVRLTQAGIRKLEPNGRFEGFIERQDDGNGFIRMSIPIKKLAFYTDMIWALGQDAKIVEPAEAIAHIKRSIADMAKLYD